MISQDAIDVEIVAAYKRGVRLPELASRYDLGIKEVRNIIVHNNFVVAMEKFHVEMEELRGREAARKIKSGKQRAETRRQNRLYPEDVIY